MATTIDISERLAFRRQALAQAQAAYTALLDGRAQQYSIGSRSLTRFDLPKLKTEITDLEKEIDSLEAQLNGGSPRKAFGVVLRDW